MASCSKAFKLPNFLKIEIIGFCLTASLHKSNFHASHAHHTFHAQTWNVEPLSDFRLEASSQAGLYFNTSKTKVMKTIRVPVRNEQDNILVNGQDIENAKSFAYLGAMIAENYDDSKEIKRRIAIAKNAMISLVNVWTDGNFNYHEEKTFKILGL